MKSKLKPVGKPGFNPGGGDYNPIKQYCMVTTNGVVKYFEAFDLSEAIKVPRKYYSDTVSVKLFEVIFNGSKKLVADYDSDEIKPGSNGFTF